MIEFLLNNEPVSIEESDTGISVQQFLRQQKQLTGTKEGCAAGDCGACTIVLGEMTADESGLQYRTVNSCITLLANLHGKQVITVEHLSDGKQLHPVQQALVDHHGSQCGFCTPGIIMSMFSLYHSDAEPTRETVNKSLSGNLCRCTGYRPIIDATTEVCERRQPDAFTQKQQQTLSQLKDIQAKHTEVFANGVHLPETREAMAGLLAAYPDARLVGGSTDLALESTQQLKSLPELISTQRMKDCKQITVTDKQVSVGAALPLSDIDPVLVAHFPALHELIERFASLPIRNQATLGGNVANASPIGDMPPVLLALNATIEADDGHETRLLPASTFFTGYRQTQLRKGEWIKAIHFPRLQANTQLRAYKVSKRHEDDISAVCAVFAVTLENGMVAAINSGFGGVAATPVSCDALAEQLIGQPWQADATRQLGKRILTSAFNPIDDVRASAAYRNQVLGNLWQRFWFETQSALLVTTRVPHYA